MKAAVLGGSGYVAGEVIRLLLGHPEIRLGQVVSASRAGRRVDGCHPTLRSITDLTFSAPDDLDHCDVLFAAMPHGSFAEGFDRWADRASLVIDLSADFRALDSGFVTGMPELFRDRLRTADRIAVPGCMATAAVLALAPVADVLEPDIVVDAKTGSSGAGRDSSANQHAERSGVMRVFAPAGHRHEAEIRALTGTSPRMTATAVEAVRGVQVLIHAKPVDELSEVDTRRRYRDRYADEPFVRVVTYRRGDYRWPEPKILAGSNFCDVGFAVRPSQPTGVVLCAALDNLVKGAAGAAVQCLNVRAGWPEHTGLRFPGLHPI